MKHKPLPIDWDELEGAFENRNEDLRYYLDLITGQVVLEGEGEDAEFDDDAEIDSAVDPESPRKETTRIYVETFTVDDELDWMDEFIEGDEKITAEQIAAWCGTISYEIVTRIHPSLPRVLV